jgi:mRNA-degrading endonuclease HigB of HigAB toxin-antitoxin module
MIDNLHQIKSLLNFEKEGDFYMLYILKRKKDQTTDKSNHQSVRTIKTYCVESVEYLEKRYEEIKELCEMFKARAYIHVQKQSHHDVSLNMLVALAERIRNGQHRQQHLFDSVVGQLKTLEKRWIIDIDGISIDGFAHVPFYQEMRRYISELQNETGKEVEMTFIRTRAGFHIIASPFNLKKFKERYPEVDVQKKNPTILYIPNSLN